MSFVGLIVRPRLTALAATIVMSVAVVLLTIVPFQPTFLVVLVLVLPALIAYPYWGDLRRWRTWWMGARGPLLTLAGAVCVALLVIAVAALQKQVINDDAAAAAHWWNDYAEHTTDLALVGLIAVSRAPGSRLLRGVLSTVYVYLGVVAAFVLPDSVGSWGVAGGLAALGVGAAFALGTWWDVSAPTLRLPRQRRGQASNQ